MQQRNAVERKLPNHALQARAAKLQLGRRNPPRPLDDRRGRGELGASLHSRQPPLRYSGRERRAGLPAPRWNGRFARDALGPHNGPLPFRREHTAWSLLNAGTGLTWHRDRSFSDYTHNETITKSPPTSLWKKPRETRSQTGPAGRSRLLAESVSFLVHQTKQADCCQRLSHI